MITLTKSDREYFSRRALQEEAAAKRSADPAVAGTHRRLAAEYQRRADQLASVTDAGVR